MNVEVCKDPALWDAFVDGFCEATNYHLWAWKEVIEETYGHKGYYLVATAEKKIEGVLPLFWMRSRIFGRFLISIPFFSYGGVLAKTTEARQALLDRAIELARDLGAHHVELRDTRAFDDNEKWQHVTPKVTMVVPLTETVEEYWGKLSSKMRQRVRSATKHGLSSEWGGLEAVDGFYSVFAANMRDLGTPVYPREWFHNICRRFPEKTRILTIRDGARIVASGIVTEFREGVELPWSGSLTEYRQKQAAVLMFWALLEWAIKQRYRWVDFGRCTRGGGVYQFKQHWLCEERPLHWYYWLAPGVSVPQLRPDNPRFRLAVRVWKRLPKGVTNWLGPHIVRSIP